MFFNLIVGELEDLKTFRQCCLGSLSLKEVIDNSLVRICLLHVSIFEIDDSISIQECFSTNTIRKNHFFFTIQVRSLHFTICSSVFSFHGHVCVVIIVIFFWVNYVKFWRIYLALSILLYFLGSYLEAASMAGFVDLDGIKRHVVISTPFTLGWAFLSQLFFDSFELHAILISATSHPAYIRVHSFRWSVALLPTECFELIQPRSYTSSDLANLIIDLFFNILKLFIVVKVRSIVIGLMEIVLTGQLRHSLL